MGFCREFLLSLQAVRDHASKVFQAAKRGGLKHFDYDESRMGEVADYVSKVIDVSNKDHHTNASKLTIVSSVILAPTNTTRFLLMVDGSILRLAAFPVSTL